MFVLRQFFVTAFYPARGGGPGQGGNGSAPPPVRKEGRRLEEWTSSEEKDLSEGVVSMSVSRSVPSFSDFNFVFSFPFIFIHFH